MPPIENNIRNNGKNKIKKKKEWQGGDVGREAQTQGVDIKIDGVDLNEPLLPSFVHFAMKHVPTVFGF